jgi:tetratricopeptide (TPR) repeat protein
MPIPLSLRASNMKSCITCLFLLQLFALLLNGCKSAEKSLKKGNYDDSVLRAVEKLKNNPTHSSSAEALKQAYPLALEQHLNDLKQIQSSDDLFKWEPQLDSYVRLNKLYAGISGCAACDKLVSAKNFENEEKIARHNAVNVRYKEGEKLLAMGDRGNARQAYEHFEKVNALMPDFNEVQKKLDLAYELASFKVVVEQVLVTSRVYQLSNEYFQERVNEYLQTNKRLNKFVRFYMPDEASKIRLQPDQVITLQFDDFVVGQTLLEKNTETFTSKDTVKVGEKFVGRSKVPVYAKVTAKLTQIRKTVRSAGLLNMRITDFRTRQIVNQEKFNGEYNWTCEWAHFNGDERALSAAQLRKCKSQELLPPDPQQLFIEFSKPIYERLTSKLQTFYAKY